MPAQITTDPQTDTSAAPFGGLDVDAFESALELVSSLAGKYDADGRFPADSIAALRAVGVLGLTVPVEYGGYGADIATAAEVIERIGTADPSVGLIVQWNFTNHLSLRRSDSPWPAALAEQVLRSAATDGALINGLAVERELGSLARGGTPATTATALPGGRWRIDGEKAYGTGISGLSWISVTATTTEKEPRVGSFLIRPETPGWEILPTWDHLGLRASDTQSVRFDGAVVEPGDVVELRDPTASTARVVGIGRQALPVLLAANYNGVSLATRDWLVDYLHRRVPTNLGAPLATVPRFIDRVGEIEAQILTAQTLVRSAAAQLDAADRGAIRSEGVPLASLAKHVSTTTAIRVTESALDLTGNPGLSRSNPLERHHRNALVGRVHFPQSDFIITGLGRRALAAAEPGE